jgi:hypothetical protein
MAILKISDLSVGDWVYYDNKNKPYSIRSIYRTGIRDCVVLNDNESLVGVIAFVDELTPIPITVEILEKNGKSDEWSTGDWEEIPSTEVSPSRQCMRVRDLGTHIFLGDKVVYVHQLQHVLRIAGVDKEINL